ncbi:MAG: DUF86 domain-containing protein [Spirulinaceae cyanobacterium]
MLYKIVIIGEAINRFSDNFITAYPQIPFAEIRGMRNRIVHEYKDVDLGIIWEATQQDIPEIIQILSPLIPFL